MSASARNWSSVPANTEAVPATSTQMPLRAAPQERKLAAVSPQPATTGTPGARPQAPAIAGVSAPTTLCGSTMRGSTAGSTPKRAHRSLSHAARRLSAKPEKCR